MSLRDLVSELFLYLVVFRRKARNKEPLRLETVANDLERIFSRMDQRAAQDPMLDHKYQRLRKVLVAIADGIVSGSDWDLALDYRTAYLLENRFYQTTTGGDYFYDELAKLGAEEADAREVYFLALALGFQGRLARQPEERLEMKQRLYRGLSGAIVDKEKVTPQAYEHTDERDCSVAPVARFGRYAIILAGMLTFFLLTGVIVYNTMKRDINRHITEIEQRVPKRTEGPGA
jgi:type IV/VI secretion system ImpK/VasF family protein